MFAKCPGRQKDIRVRYLKCPSCKKDVVYSEKDSCIYWCKAAKDCLMRF